MSTPTVPHGTFCWHELLSKNAELCKTFYSELFGWDSKEQEIGGMKHTIFSKDGAGLASMIQISEEMGGVSPAWVTYIAVDDVDAAVKRAGDLGGKVVIPPSDIPDVGRVAMVVDPGDTAVALIKLAG